MLSLTGGCGGARDPPFLQALKMQRAARRMRWDELRYRCPQGHHTGDACGQTSTQPPAQSCILHFQPKTQLQGCWHQDLGQGTVCWAVTQPQLPPSQPRDRDRQGRSSALGEPRAGLNNESSSMSTTASPPRARCVPGHPDAAGPRGQHRTLGRLQLRLG